MSIAELRKEVHKYVDEVDESFLSNIHGIIKAYIGNENHAPGYTVGGASLTQEKIIKRATEASVRVKSGKYISHEEVEKRAKNW